MSFRKFGGLQYSAKHNSVSSYYNTSNNLQVTTIGQPNTYIVVESGLTGNINTNAVPDNAWIEAAIQAAVKEAVQAALKDFTPTGMIGHAGPTGPQGSIGPTGLEGSKGIEGPTGSRGLEGPTGPAGPTNSTTGDASTIFTLKDARKSIDIIGPLILQASANTNVPTSYSKDIPNIDDIKSVSVGTDVTSIGDSAFKGATGLTSITIPNTVTDISNNAFYGANKLTTVTFAQNSQLQSIGANAFAYDASLSLI